MQSGMRKGPRPAEVYWIKIWMRRLPGPRLMARFFAVFARPAAPIHKFSGAALFGGMARKKPRLSRGLKMSVLRNPARRHRGGSENLRCALSALRSIRELRRPPGGCAERGALFAKIRTPPESELKGGVSGSAARL
jgi:hypothetical protein